MNEQKRSMIRAMTAHPLEIMSARQRGNREEAIARLRERARAQSVLDSRNSCKIEEGRRVC